ncbi:MAG: hypothetical protein U0935_21675, partial [Pirellulales bacterium]
ADGTLRLWQLNIPRLLRVAAYLCGRALTAEERERFDITRPAGEPPPREPEEIVASQTRSGWLRFVLNSHAATAVLQVNGETREARQASDVPSQFELVSITVGPSNRRQPFQAHCFLLYCRELRDLDLTGQPIVDDDLRVLMQFTRLQRLVVSGTRLSSRGRQQLRDLLPQCDIIAREDIATTVRLLAPPSEAVLPTGSPDRPMSPRWEFRWAAVERAEKYQLFVQSQRARLPVIDTEVSGTTYVDTQSRQVAAMLRRDWRWKVRALVDGTWGPWSEERMFHLAPDRED